MEQDGGTDMWCGSFLLLARAQQQHSEFVEQFVGRSLACWHKGHQRQFLSVLLFSNSNVSNPVKHNWSRLGCFSEGCGTSRKVLKYLSGCNKLCCEHGDCSSPLCVQEKGLSCLQGQKYVGAPVHAVSENQHGSSRCDCCRKMDAPL